MNGSHLLLLMLGNIFYQIEAWIIFSSNVHCSAISITPLVCRNNQTSLPARRARSIFSSFFEKIHKLVEEKERILAKHKEQEERTADAEEQKSKDVVVIKEAAGGCKTEFVVVESVHYALVRGLAGFKFLPK